MAKLALIRLEDVGPSALYTDSQNLIKLQAIANYLESQGIVFQVAVVPHSVDPPNNYSKSISELNDPVVEAFNNMLRYCTQHGGTLHMKGYTNQYSLASTGYEFFSLSCPGNCPPDDSASARVNVNSFIRSYATSRMVLGLDAIKSSGLPFSGCFITPEYSASATQRSIIEAWLGILYENDPSNPSKRTVSIKDISNPFYQGVVYVPTPLGTVSQSNPDSDIQRICNDILSYTGDDLASFYFYPYMEFPFIHITQSGIVYDNNSYLKRLIQCFKQQSFKFVNIYDIVNFVPGMKQTNFGPSLNKKVLLTGDVNADGKTDFIIWQSDYGLWYFAFNGMGNYPERQNPGFSLYVALTGWGGGGAWNAYAGDFNGDKQTDVTVWDPNSGEWQVALSDGSSLVPSPGRGGGEWLKPWAVGYGWVPFVGDFNGDGIDDILVWDYAEGYWQVALSNGQYFTPQPTWLGPWAVGDRWMPFIGDFNGDGKDDIVVWDPATGDWQVALSDGSKFIPQGSWLKPWAASSAWKPLIGDFDGDGKDDIIVVDVSSGNWQTAQSTGTQFTAVSPPFIPWAADPAAMPYAGDFNGDGKDDICTYHGTVPNSIINIAISKLKPLI